MKKLLSYIWPITTYIDSDINGKLELTWFNGKKVLDGKKANFSYGSLERILDFGLSKIFLKKTDTVLVLGLGGGNIIKKLKHKFQHIGRITAVELDKKVIQIAEKEFGIKSDANLKIIHQDALLFVQKCTKKYDFIFVDIFVDDTVPNSFYKIVFWEKVISLLSKNGKILFNAGVKLQDENHLQKIKTNFKDIMEVKIYTKVDKTNTLLVFTAKK